MKIVVIGGTGLIGSKTVAILRHGGHEVVACPSPKPRPAAKWLILHDPHRGLAGALRPRRGCPTRRGCS